MAIATARHAGARPTWPVAAAPSRPASQGSKTQELVNHVVKYLSVLRSGLGTYVFEAAHGEELHMLDEKLRLIVQCQPLGNTIKAAVGTVCKKIHYKYMHEPAESRRLCYYNRQYFEEDLQVLEEAIRNVEAEVKQMAPTSASAKILQSLEETLEAHARNTKKLKETAAEVQDLSRQRREFRQGEEEVVAQLRAAQEQVRQCRADVDSNKRRLEEIYKDQQRLQKDQDAMDRTSCPIDASMGRVHASAQVGFAAVDVATSVQPELEKEETRLAQLHDLHEAASSLVLFLSNDFGVCEKGAEGLNALLSNEFKAFDFQLLPDLEKNNPGLNTEPATAADSSGFVSATDLSPGDPSSDTEQVTVTEADQTHPHGGKEAQRYRISTSKGLWSYGWVLIKAITPGSIQSLQFPPVSKAPLLSIALRELMDTVHIYGRPIVVIWHVEAYCVDDNAMEATMALRKKAEELHFSRSGRGGQGFALVAIHRRSTTAKKTLRSAVKLCQLGTPEYKTNHWKLEYVVEGESIKSSQKLHKLVEEQNLAEKHKISEKKRVVEQHQERLRKREEADKAPASRLREAQSCAAVQGERRRADRQLCLQRTWEESQNEMRQRSANLEEENRRLTQDTEKKEAQCEKLVKEDIPTLEQEIEHLRVETAQQETGLRAKQDGLLAEIDSIDHWLAVVREVQQAYQDLVSILQNLQIDARKLMDLCLGPGDSWNSLDDQSKEALVRDVFGYYEGAFGVPCGTQQSGQQRLQQIIELTMPGDRTCIALHKAAADLLCTRISPEQLCRISLDSTSDALRKFLETLKANLHPEEGAWACELVHSLAQDFKEAARLVAIKNQVLKVRAAARPFSNS